MKRSIFVLALLGGMAFLTGCSYGNATTPVQDKIIPSELNKEKEEVPEIKKISYTTKNGLVSFSYPEKTFIPGDVNQFVPVVVEDKGDFVAVHPEGMSLSLRDASYLSIISKAKIEKSEINTFVQKTFGDSDCIVHFDQKYGLIWRGEINGVLSDDENDCHVLNIISWYDPANKVLVLKNSGKTGDFFTSGSNINSSDLQDGIHESVRFSYLQKVFPIHYINEQFGFELNLPKTWEKYIVTKRTLDWGDFGTSDSFDFGLDVQDSLFNIGVHSKDQWKKIEQEQNKESIYMQTYLGENEKYVFSFASSYDLVNEEAGDRVDEARTILHTFQVK